MKLQLLIDQFDLPDRFWINEDSYSDDLMVERLGKRPTWNHVEIPGL
jgi:hypothetical protein